jgi:uncharacterized protein YndB with AHSA1/START domain
MPSVRREVVLPVPREEAWALLTGDDAIREWLAEDAVLEPEVGGEVRADGRRGVVEEVDEGRRLIFRWDDGIDEARVEWTLSEDPAVDAVATRVVVVERRLEPVFAAAWAPKLSALARASALCPA